MRSPVEDLRFGFRTLLKSPGFALVAVLSLALGIGVTSAVFSIVNGVLLDGLPWGDPERIVTFELRKRVGDPRPRGMTPAQFVDFAEQSRSLQGLIAVEGAELQFTDGQAPQLVFAPRVSADALTLMQIKPLHGRGFSADDAQPNAQPVIMLSERLWTDRYGRDPGLVGRSVEINGQQVTVIGVISSAQWFPNPDAMAVTPLPAPTGAPSRSEERLGLMGRLKPGVDVAQLQAEVDLIVRRLAEQHPETDGEYAVRAFALRDRITNESSARNIRLLMGAVSFVLLIVCANLANLLLARSAAREKELATRSALGATRAQIVLQLMWECAVIGLLALPIALVLTRLCLDYFVAIVPSRVTWIEQFFRYDLRVGVFAGLITFATVILFGLAPALRTSRVDLVAQLNAGGNRGGTDAGSQRLRSMLVVAQIGLSLSLLVMASLFSQAFTRIQNADPGFALDGVSSASIGLTSARYATADKIRSFQNELQAALSEMPPGIHAAMVSTPPLAWPGPLRDFQISGRETAGREDAPRARWTSASPGYFATIGLRLQTGRDFGSGDLASSQPVAIVSRLFAERFFPGESPVGKRIVLRETAAIGAAGGAREIVGVVSDVRSFNGGGPPEWEPRIYEPIAQQPQGSFGVVLRSNGGPLAGVPELRRHVRRLDRQLAVSGAATMRDRLDFQLWRARFVSTLMSILGGMALLLAIMGVYGVVSYSTARRRREFGIRTALGAEPRHIAALVLRKTGVLAGFGIALGLLLALLMSRAVQSMLFEIDARDPGTLAAISLLLGFVTLLAGALPMWRAVREQPMDSLRVE